MLFPFEKSCVKIEAAPNGAERKWALMSYQPLADKIRPRELDEMVGQQHIIGENGVLRKGKLGKDITVEEGYEAARIAALNCLAVVKSLAGSLDRVERVVKVVGFVNCTPDFEAQPKVINGASELLGQVFGDAGLHARSAVGVSSLPLGACCEVDLIVRLKP